ncbi:MAG: translation initiation factor IF-3 [Ilumatobacteraceae bacterium]|nr:translation initiation factor IF-3 [Ilumatobacteraceae bacterium]NQW59402.1 translation initiation factor IF-3 [bacterium]
MATATNEPRYNDRIRAREVRLIDAQGNQLGIKNLPEALELAKQSDLDLVEVAPLAVPPVCRIMDYGKFRYEEAQKAKESRKKTTQVTIKEVKLRPKIGKGDFDTKVRHMHDFLEDGHKVKVTLQFRGREMAHPELGSRLLDNVIEQLGEGVRVETQARLEGRNMTMVLSSDKKVVKKADEKPAVKPSEKPKVIAEAVPVPAAITPEVEVSVTESGEVHAENEN